jgi:hypothetical protein
MCTLEDVLTYDASGDYMDIDDIMVTQSPMACVTIPPLRRLGFLDKSCTKEDIDANTKLDLPCWMIEVSPFFSLTFEWHTCHLLNERFRIRCSELLMFSIHQELQ